jgi:hypothetical protein
MAVALLPHHGKDRAGDVIGPNRVISIFCRSCAGDGSSK